MLDMLLTADAARKHDHDHHDNAAAPNASHSHSHSPAPAATHAASFLVQMPLSIVGSFLRRQTPSPSPSRSPHSAAPDSKPSTDDAPLDTPVIHRPVSSGSSAATDEKPKKREPRSKTSYICAWPPRSKHKRPKVLLQLHQVVPSQRPKPTYEVIPFSLLPTRSTRRLARVFNTKERLGSNDLLIVKAQDYAKDEYKKSDDEDWGSREVIGVICPAKSDKDVTEICMDDGVSRWEVTSMPNGGLEFNTADDHGLALKARWVPKPSHSRRISGMSASSQTSPTFPPGQDDTKYTFSTISPTSRRHPIIATMTQNRIDVMDSYSIPSTTSPSTPAVSVPQSPPITPSSIDMNSFLDKPSDQAPIQTDEALRRFIVVSGVWVAQHGLNPNAPAPSDTPSNARVGYHRTVSMSNVDSPRSASPASTLDDSHRSFPKMLRTGSDRLPRCMSFSDSTHSPVSIRSQTASPVLKTRSRRANSTGNANLHSMSGSMRKRYGLAFEGEALPETEEERQGKRSAELLRIKELTLPTALERISSELPASTTPFHPSNSIPEPIIIPPSSDGPKSPIPKLSPALSSPDLRSNEKRRKTRSAYNPVDTAGMWDSGVTEGPGLRSRPTSMFVINEKKRKQEKKRERSRNKEESDKGVPCKKHDWHKIKTSIKGIFRKEKV